MVRSARVERSGTLAVAVFIALLSLRRGRYRPRRFSLCLVIMTSCFV